MPERSRVGVNLSARAIAREMVERGECLARPLAQWLLACFSFHRAPLARSLTRRTRTASTGPAAHAAGLAGRAAHAARLEGSAGHTADFGGCLLTRVPSDCRHAAASSVCVAADLEKGESCPRCLLLAAGWTPRQKTEGSPWGSTLLAVRARELNRLQKLKSSVRPFEARGDESWVIRKV